MKPLSVICAATFLALGSTVGAMALPSQVTMNSMAGPQALGSLLDRVGTWSNADITALMGANSVQVFNAQDVLTDEDYNRFDSAENTAASKVFDLHQAIRKHSDLVNWFATHDISINRLAAIVPNGDRVDLFLN